LKFAAKSVDPHMRNDPFKSQLPDEPNLGRPKRLMYGDRTVNHFGQARRVLWASSLAGSLVIGFVGCSSPGGMKLASLNPFSSGEAEEVSDPSRSSITASIASTTDAARQRIGSLGTSARTAVSKSTDAVKGMFASARFNRATEEDTESEVPSSTDPLSLANKPEEVDADVYVANGRLWESSGNPQKAMESYTKALENEPASAEALGSIARLHFRDEDYKKAAEFFGRAIQAAPEDAGLFNDLGLTLSRLGNHRAAAETLGRALELAPGTSRYANNLASVLYDAGENESAYGVLLKNNKPAVAHFNIAYLHHKNGKNAEAIRHLNEVLKFEPQAVSDEAVKKAVTRSREMLAQLSGDAMNSVAQASPTATVASRPTATAAAAVPPSAGVQQTSQAVPTSSPVTLPAVAKPTSSGASTPTASPAVPNAGWQTPSFVPSNFVPPSVGSSSNYAGARSVAETSSGQPAEPSTPAVTVPAQAKPQLPAAWRGATSATVTPPGTKAATGSKPTSGGSGTTEGLSLPEGFQP
jgi:tetratricopeptide (TPR) repeat protein